MKKSLLIAAFSAAVLSAAAQVYDQIWMCTRVPWGGTAWGLDFTSTAPLPFIHPPGSFSANVAICNPAGVLQFYTDGMRLFDRNKALMPNGDALVYPPGGTSYSRPPLVAPDPGDTNRYYVFTQFKGGIYYTLVDMQLNGGLGDVVAGKKNIPLNVTGGLNAIAGTAKSVVVPGCGCLWLVVRSRHVNEYRAYRISDTGIRLQPVISVAGGFPLSFYEGYNYQGTLKASPDGRQLVACLNMQGPGYPGPGTGGLECYDFDPYTGIVSNARELDSGTHYYSACFSPDGTKLYATAFFEHKVYQFDLAAGSLPAITASKTPVLTNPSIYYTIDPLGAHLHVPTLGDLKRGRDGRIYVGNNVTEQMMLTTGGFSANSKAFHAITQPDQPGLACAPLLHAVFIDGRTGIDLPPDVPLPAVYDTSLHLRDVVLCYQDSVVLTAGSGDHHYWDNGDTATSRIVKAPGIYRVWYRTSACSIHCDRFAVVFVTLPKTSDTAYSCPGGAGGTLWISSTDSTSRQFRWYDAGGRLLQQSTGLTDTLRAPDTGNYFIRVGIAAGCDTTLSLRVESLPVPKAAFAAPSQVCYGTQVAFEDSSSQAVKWQWQFGDGKEAQQQHPQHQYRVPGDYPVQLVVHNIEGCSDTARRWISAKDFELRLRASDTQVAIHQELRLLTQAEGAYHILSWSPEALFPDQHKKEQWAGFTESTRVVVTGSSELGCPDSASIWIRVRPLLWLPSAFSPNGDGRNDLFRPVVTTPGARVQLFEIYNRWGQCVWRNSSNDPAAGWDGTHRGTAAEAGVYFYQLRAELPDGHVVQLKGDVTLVR